MSQRTSANSHPQVKVAPIPRASYSVEEAAIALGIGRTYAYRLIREGELQVVRLGRRTLIPVASVQALLERNMAPPTEVSGAAE